MGNKNENSAPKGLQIVQQSASYPNMKKTSLQVQKKTEDTIHKCILIRKQWSQLTHENKKMLCYIIKTTRNNIILRKYQTWIEDEQSAPIDLAKILVANNESDQYFLSSLPRKPILVTTSMMTNTLQRSISNGTCRNARK